MTIEKLIEKVNEAKSKKDVFSSVVDIMIESVVSDYIKILNDDSKPFPNKIQAFIDYNFSISIGGAEEQKYEMIHSPAFKTVHRQIAETSMKRAIEIFNNIVKVC